MPNENTETALETDDIPALDIALEKVCFIIMKAREFDVKDAPTVSDPGSNATDDHMIGVLEQRPDDPVEQELRAFIGALSEDEQVDLIALAWLTRDENAIEDWKSVREEAAQRHAGNGKRTADYLLGDPLISDYLEVAISLFGASCESFELNRL